MSNESAAPNLEGTRYLWLDENGVRCSPRHGTVRAALNFKRNWPESMNGRWMREAGKDPVYVTSGHYAPSEKEPVKMVKAEWVMTDLDDEERARVDQVIDLVDGGYV